MPFLDSFRILDHTRDSDHFAWRLNPFDCVALKRLDDKTVEATLKKSGTPVMTVRTTISADRKTRTSVFTGKNEKGEDVNNAVVSDRK
jgi:hypothetical protein